MCIWYSLSDINCSHSCVSAVLVVYISVVVFNDKWKGCYCVFFGLLCGCCPALLLAALRARPWATCVIMEQLSTSRHTCIYICVCEEHAHNRKEKFVVREKFTGVNYKFEQNNF